MDDPIFHGHAFVVGDLWRAPSRFLQPHEQHGSIFEALDTKTTRLDLPLPEEAPHFLFETDLPALPDLDAIATLPTDAQENPLLVDSSEGEDLDVWNLDLVALEPPGESTLHTWEAFDGKSVENAQRTAFVSEAGQSAFDALNGLTNKEGVLPQGYTLRSFCSLAHGRSSTLFQWNEENCRFQSVLPHVSISGVSQMCTESLANDMMEMGTSIVRLRKFGDAAYSSRLTCSAVVAMQNSIVSVLDAIDEIVCSELRAVRSLLQLQNLVFRPRQLLAVLVSLVESARDCRTDESLISALSDRVHALVQSNGEHAAVLQAFLARVSVPWLERLSLDLGLRNNTPASVGTSYSMQDVEDVTRERHTFLEEAEVELVRETKMAVILLRELSPNHPLLGGSSATSPSLEDFTAVQPAFEVAQLYGARVMPQLVVGNAPTNRSSVGAVSEVELDEHRLNEHRLDEHRLDEASQEDYVAGLEGLMSQEIDIGRRPAADELHDLVGLACHAKLVHDKDRELDLSTCVKSTPLEQVRPLIRTQNRLLNGVLLRQVLRDYHLRQQLSMQKQFQLLGSGDFVTRLSTALFSLDVQSAERKRGVIPTGQVMGLRLGSSPEQRWPPASSELRLTLAGVLEESQGLKTGVPGSREDRTGALSFAIRELPEEEIDRVFDVHSVYALDFLRLQYVPTPPLDAIITPEALQQYDVVFRYLLKLFRLIAVVKSLPRRKFGSRGAATSEKMIAFCNESHHLVSVLMAHAMELGINAPWEAFVTSIGQLEQALEDEDAAGEIGTKATVGIQGLRQMHEACLDRIRGRLLLKRKHTKLRVAIEEVFAAILQFEAIISTSGGMETSAFEEQYANFLKAGSQLCEVLQQVVEKPPKVMSAAESEDADTIRMLLLKLNWNDFYPRA